MIGRINNSRGARFNNTETDALRSLRAKYQVGHYLFTERELAHLRFLRWLVRSSGWNRAMDQPSDTGARYIPAVESATWMPGFIA